MAKTLTPWGRNIPVSTVGKAGKPRGSSMRRPSRPHRSLRTMDYPKNRPNLWPVVGGVPKRGNTSAAVTRHNAIVNRSYARGGYAG